MRRGGVYHGKLRSRERDDMHAMKMWKVEEYDPTWLRSRERDDMHAIPEEEWRELDNLLRSRERDDMHAMKKRPTQITIISICYDPANGMTCMQSMFRRQFGYETQVTIPRTG